MAKVSLYKKILKKWDLIKDLKNKLQEVRDEILIQSNTASDSFRRLRFQEEVIAKELQLAEYDYEKLMEEFIEEVDKKET